jgi:hypothetical protein
MGGAKLRAVDVQNPALPDVRRNEPGENREVAVESGIIPGKSRFIAGMLPYTA